MRILDCTLRDGGYYNNWDFDEATVMNYLAAMEEIQVDVVEIGFRFASRNGFLGPYAYVSDRQIKRIGADKYSFDIAIMIEEADLTRDSALTPREFIRNYFKEASSTPVSIVRIATHFSKLPNVYDAVEELNHLGYKVAVNIMQISRYPEREIVGELTKLRDNCSPSIIYFADSLGDMTPDQVTECCRIFTSVWSADLGFHGHDNRGLGLQNSRAAINGGCSIIDCTVTGMGRGAGNTKTEDVLFELREKKEADYPTFLSLVLDTFDPMKRKYGWGASILYSIAAKNTVHPMYVQSLLREVNDLTYSEIAGQLFKLGERDASSYDLRRLHVPSLEKSEDSANKYKVSDVLHSDTVLLVGPGEALLRHLSAMQHFTRASDFPVIACSLKLDLTALEFTHLICCSPRVNQSVLEDVATYPLGTMISPADLTSSFTESRAPQFVRFGCEFEENEIYVDDNCCRLGLVNSLLYAIAACAAAGVTKFKLAGFDGYGKDDPRTIKISYWMEKLERALGIEIVTLLPSAYQIKSESVYASYN